MADEQVYVVGTEKFYNDYSGDAATKRNAIKAYGDDTWYLEVEDGSGDYKATYTDFSQSDVEVPESALSDCCAELGTRRTDAQDWLSNNWGSYSEADVVLVVDWYGGDHRNNESSHTYGVAGIGDAGDGNKTAIVDTYYEDKGILDSQLEAVGTNGIAVHEVWHEYCAVHSQAARYSNCRASLMYSPGADVGDCVVECRVNPSVKRTSSSCVRSRVRCYIDEKEGRGNCGGCNS